MMSLLQLRQVRKRIRRKITIPRALFADILCLIDGLRRAPLPP